MKTKRLSGASSSSHGVASVSSHVSCTACKVYRSGAPLGWLVAPPAPAACPRKIDTTPFARYTSTFSAASPSPTNGASPPTSPSQKRAARYACKGSSWNGTLPINRVTVPNLPSRCKKRVARGWAPPKASGWTPPTPSAGTPPSLGNSQALQTGWRQHSHMPRRSSEPPSGPSPPASFALRLLDWTTALFFASASVRTPWSRSYACRLKMASRGRRECVVERMGARALMERRCSERRESSASPTQSHLLRTMRSAEAICRHDSTVSNWRIACCASTSVMMASRASGDSSSSSNQSDAATGPGSAMPVVSMMTWSKRPFASINRSIAKGSSSRTSQQTQPLASSIHFSNHSPFGPRIVAASRPVVADSSFWMTAILSPCFCPSTCRSSVVLPAPRKPESSVTGVGGRERPSALSAARATRSHAMGGRRGGDG
mmetsp:Transcript_20666/g.58050  ORF Transcript_20666/g.58050 Transcript_20666/m.58050 type:complete len:431 (+) Transcript_20666:615-1907(+)